MTIAEFTFDRARGVVWVCDIKSSSGFLNDDSTVAELEEFLPRFYWVSIALVESAGGRFIKWTGDGFLAWFETPLHRDLESRVAVVCEMAWHLSFLVNVTQLGMTPKRSFGIRHGVTYEQDAKIVTIKKDGHSLFDIIGRSVVLAFRLSGIEAEFPSIIADQACGECAVPNQKFGRLKFSKDELLKYFKGERRGTERVYASQTTQKQYRNAVHAKKSVDRIIKEFEERSISDEHTPSELRLRKFSEAMMTGPGWAKAVAMQHLEFIKKDMLGSLKEALSALEVFEAKRKSSASPEELA